MRGTSVTVTSNSADAGAGVPTRPSSARPRAPARGRTSRRPTRGAVRGELGARPACADGLYDLRSITTDKAGNAITSALVTNVRVDNTAPTVPRRSSQAAPPARSRAALKIYFKSNAAGSFDARDDGHR